MKRSVLWVGCVSILLVAACDGGGTQGSDAGIDASASADAAADASAPDAGQAASPCEPLSPAVCGMPFPSSYFLEADSSTETGYRVNVGEILHTHLGYAVSGNPLSTRDGFSVNAAILAHLPHATMQGFARPDSIGHSLEDDSPTILIDAETGERVAHFAQIDAATDHNPDGPALILQPTRPLEHGTRYIVAVRNVIGEDGSPVAPSPVFAALRDGTDSVDPYVSARRADFEDIFTKLDGAGIGRSDLQLAWDFVTGSLTNDTQWMLSMRDQGLAMVGSDGPTYRIDMVEEAPNADVARRIHVIMTVPLFLDQADPGGTLVFGADGMPQVNGTAEYPLLVIVPANATPDNPATPMAVGHGLFGNRFYAEGFESFANEHNYLLFATDWIGMSDQDVGTVARVLSTGHVDEFAVVPDRVSQGMLNALLAMRLMMGRFVNEPLVNETGGSLVDTSERYYFGGSQGGIYGGTYMALTTDVTRGILAVPGQPYDLLLPRSVDFSDYQGILSSPYPDGTDIMMVLGYVQQLWDRIDPGSYTRHIRSDLLPGNTDPHEVMMALAIGDHQVSTIGGHVMVRAVGAPNLKPVNRSVYDIDEVDAPITGSFMVEVDFGLPPEPLDNVPLTEGDDPHGQIGVPPVFTMADEFLRTGGISANPCTGPCDPE